MGRRIHEPAPLTSRAELLVRSSMLLSAVEASACQAVSRSAKGVIIAQFEGLAL